MLYTLEEAKQHLSDEFDNINEDDLHQYADSAVPIYTADIQREWNSLDRDDQNRWREAFSLSDLGEDKDIDYLMTVDLYLYYDGLYHRAYTELCNDKEAEEE